MMSLSRERSQLVAACLLTAVLAGLLSAFDETIALLLVGLLASLIVTALLPFQYVLYVFILLSLTGIRPLPPVLGYDIQAQYVLLPALLLGVILRGRSDLAEGTQLRGAIVAATLLGLAAFVALVHGVLNGGSASSGAFGTYVKWNMGLLYLAVFLVGVGGKRDRISSIYNTTFIILVGFAAAAVLSSLTSGVSGAGLGTFRAQLLNLGPNRTGALAAAGAVMALAPIAAGRLEAWKLLSLGAFLSLLVLTGSREAVVALVAGGIVLLFNVQSARAASWYIYSMTVALVLVGLAVIFGGFLPAGLAREVSPYPQLIPYLTISGVHIPAFLAERLYFADYGIHVFFSQPLFGLGFDRSLDIPSATTYGAPTLIRTAHNSFISIAAQQGVVGLAAFVGMVWVVLRAARRLVAASEGTSYVSMAVGIRCALVVLVADSFMDDALYYDSNIMFIFFLLFGMCLLLTPFASRQKSLQEAPGHTRTPLKAQTLGPLPDQRRLPFGQGGTT